MIVARALSISCGVLLVVAAMLLYEDDERRVQNRLEEWWIRLADIQSSTLNKTARLLRAAARWVDGQLDRLFGPRLLSVRAVGVSGCLSAASLFLLLLAIAPFLNFSVEPDTTATLGWWRWYFGQAFAFFYWFPHSGLPMTLLRVGAPIFLCAGLAPLLSDKLRAIPLLMLLLLGPALFAWSLAAGGPWSGLWLGATGVSMSMSLYLALLLSVFADFLMLVVVRRLLRLQASAASARSAVLLAVLMVLLTAVLTVAPFAALEVLPQSGVTYVRYLDVNIDGRLHHVFEVTSWKFYARQYVIHAVHAWLGSDVYDIAIGLFLPLLLLLLLLNRLAWAVLERPLYALQRIGMFNHRKTMAAIGVGLIALGLPGSRDVLAKLLAFF